MLTTDRDLGDTNSFEHIEINTWIVQDGFNIMYLSPDKLRYNNIKRIIQTLNPDKIYLNSMFSRFTIFSLICSLYTNKIVLAPRGMLKPSALSVKPIKKYFYLSLLRVLNVDQYIRFHSTGTDETSSIKKIFPNAKTIIEASNLPVSVNKELVAHSKEKGKLNMVFVGRSHPIKNLLFLLECLENIKGNCILKIITTKEDEEYWQQCLSKIKILTHIETIVLFDVPHHEVKDHLEWADLFVLPTRGENFGHAIFEALAVGCPVLISDQTPWKNLNNNMAGMEMSINDPSLFCSAIQEFIDMNDKEWQIYRRGALQLAQHHLLESNAEMLYFQLFKSKNS